MMKKIVLAFVLVCGFSMTAFADDAATTAPTEQPVDEAPEADSAE